MLQAMMSVFRFPILHREICRAYLGWLTDAYFFREKKKRRIEKKKKEVSEKNDCHTGNIGREKKKRKFNESDRGKSKERMSENQRKNE